MNFNVFNSLILAGVIQGLVFSVVWLTNKKYRARNTYFLVALIVVYSLSNLQYYLLDTEFVSISNFYSYIYIAWPLLMPALFYYYGTTLLDSSKVFSKLEKLFFLPFIIGLLLSLSYKFQIVALGKEPGFSEFYDQLVPTGEYIAIVFSFAVLVYLILKVNRFLRSQRFSVKKVLPQVKWFRNLLILQLFAVVLWTYSEIKYGYSTENYYFYPIWILIALIIYWMGHVGIYKYGIDEQRKKIRKVVRERYSIAEVLPRKNEHINLLEQFIKVEKNYLNPNLSLEAVSSHLGLSTGYLSTVINSELGVSFKDYINNLRVEEAKLYLKDPDFDNYTLVAIGLEAGFNSKSAFNASFKKITGITPSQYRKQ